MVDLAGTLQVEEAIDILQPSTAVTQPIDLLARDVAAELWDLLPRTDYASLPDLADDVLGLIFLVQAESLAADSSLLVWWEHELELSAHATLICQVERIADNPQHFTLYYEDPYNELLPIVEWDDADGASVLQELAD